MGPEFGVCVFLEKKKPGRRFTDSTCVSMQTDLSPCQISGMVPSKWALIGDQTRLPRIALTTPDS